MPFPVSEERIAESGLTEQNVATWEVEEQRQAGMVTTLRWGGEAHQQLLRQNLSGRLALAALLLQKKVQLNLNIPVMKIPRIRVRNTSRFPFGGPVGSQYTYVPPESRSKPGEFPRADTTLLRDSIFADGPHIDGDRIMYRVGMPLDYGAALELAMDRSFLVRTLDEMWTDLYSIINAPNVAGNQEVAE
jgi:hypothetical protein